MIETIVIVLASLMLYLSIVASIHLSKSDAFSAPQKFYQYVLIWMIPIIGSVIVLSVLMEELSPVMERKNQPSFLFKLVALSLFFETTNSKSNNDLSEDDGGFDSGGYDSGGDGGGDG